MKIFRLIELVFVLLLIVLFFPVFLLISVSIKLNSQGSIFFSSPRIGLNGKRFYCFKFRTMYQKNETILTNFFFQHPEKAIEWERFHKLKEDPRVYSLGRFLRKTSLDELPQLFNVLLGDMSIIGPRPLLDSDLAQIPNHLKTKFLSVKPGITGIWQISGRSLLSFSKRIELESQYIDQKNVFLDIKILLKTIPVVLFRKGAC